MAPQAATTATATPAPTTADAGNGGLSQAQLGGILGGVVAFVVLTLILWYWVTHTDGYALYREQRNHRKRAQRARQRYYRQQWQRRSPRRRSFYETEVSYRDSASSLSEGTSEARFAQMQHMARLQHMQAAAQQEAQEQAERERRAASVATSGPYVLNQPPLRFPPTARRANYRQTAWPQIRGVRRIP